MRKSNYQDDFEQFLQDEVKQHRMYPSDHIWKNIRTQIHGYRAWPALTFVSLFIITALTISTLLNNHPDRHLLEAEIALANEPAVAASKTVAANGQAQPVVEKNVQYFKQIAPEQITAETFADLRQDLVAVANPVETIATSAISHDALAPAPSRSTANADRISKLQTAIVPQQVSAEPNTTDIITNSSANTAVVTPDLNPVEEKTPSATELIQPLAKAVDHASADAFFKDFNFISNTPPRTRNSKFGFQFYVTPSTSYRRLSDQKVKEIIQPAIAAAQNVPLSVNASANVNDVVRHKPAMGIELGFGLLYNMTGKLKFKTGVQLNIRQYYIETFQSLTNDLTSLSLINYRGIETISFYSPYNNNTGYKKTQLDNKVYQLSVPLGFEWDVIQGKHLGINAEASVQPTLTLNTNTYLLSTDYKHYTTGNDLIRKWNINTSVGFNISYKVGSTLFMAGPQVRYQHMPTYSNLYPIKEYLLDYGVRLGITRQLKYK